VEGDFVAVYSGEGLVAIHFPTGAKPRPIKPVPPNLRGWHRLTIAAIRSILEGRMPNALPPMNLSSGTEFQRRVWRALGKIPPGETLSYGELAAAIGRPKAARAVGAACGANPIPLLIPCHRVLAAGGRLGGFTAGLAWKRKLLEREGIQWTAPAVSRS
jgi:O-6-methylguanine DNA methyltransferase